VQECKNPLTTHLIHYQLIKVNINKINYQN
jgi:hypothetical protein